MNMKLPTVVLSIKILSKKVVNFIVTAQCRHFDISMNSKLLWYQTCDVTGIRAWQILFAMLHQYLNGITY